MTPYFENPHESWAQILKYTNWHNVNNSFFLSCVIFYIFEKEHIDNWCWLIRDKFWFVSFQKEFDSKSQRNIVWIFTSELLIFDLIEMKDDICRDDVRRQYFHNSSYVKKCTYVPHLVLFVLALIKKYNNFTQNTL